MGLNGVRPSDVNDLLGDARAAGKHEFKLSITG
jgi:hypothetical protein